MMDLRVPTSPRGSSSHAARAKALRSATMVCHKIDGVCDRPRLAVPKMLDSHVETWHPLDYLVMTENIILRHSPVPVTGLEPAHP